MKVFGIKVNEIDQYINLNDFIEVNFELGEVNCFEWVGNINLMWKWEEFQVGWQMQYMDE